MKVFPYQTWGWFVAVLLIIFLPMMQFTRQQENQNPLEIITKHNTKMLLLRCNAFMAFGVFQVTACMYDRITALITNRIVVRNI